MSNINHDFLATSVLFTSSSDMPAAPTELESTAPPTHGWVLFLLWFTESASGFTTTVVPGR